MTTASKPLDVRLMRVARGYRQRQALATLLRGQPLIHPCYWRNDTPITPRWQELQSWRNFLQRLTQAGYVVLARHESAKHPAFTSFSLLTGREVE